MLVRRQQLTSYNAVYFQEDLNVLKINPLLTSLLIFNTCVSITSELKNEFYG